jgi:hypothetical protein
MGVNYGDADLAVHGEILRTLVGSTVYGTGVDDQDDRDEMGICVEPKEYVLGLARFDQHVHRTRSEGERSGPGDVDLTIYSLRKWARLAAAGNPTVLTPLFAPGPIVRTDQGMLLREYAALFVSRQAGGKYLGYLRSQREKLLGERGNRTNRPELVERYGFDTKFAYHAVRLAAQGVEFLTTGHIELPIAQPLRRWLIEVRTGHHRLQDVLDVISTHEADLERLVHDDNIPATTDGTAIVALLVDIHESWWQRPAGRELRPGS